MARDPAFNTRTADASASGDRTAIAAPWDPLADPANDDLISSALTMWPVGPAWGSPDGQAVSLDSNLARFTRVMVDTFCWLYARAFRLVREATVQGVSETIEEWERDYGLPDDCSAESGTVAERLRALEAKVNSVAAITPGDFIRVAASYGFTITIEEPAVFRCGFSECGGEHTAGAASQEVYWIVHIDGLAVDYFRAGDSECGFDPLFSLGEAERLLCMLRRIAPAWTVPILAN